MQNLGNITDAKDLPTKKYIDDAVSGKVNKNQGSENANKWLGTDAQGNVVCKDLPIYDGSVI